MLLVLGFVGLGGEGAYNSVICLHSMPQKVRRRAGCRGRVGVASGSWAGRGEVV